MRFRLSSGELHEHPLIRRLVMLDLDPADFVIVGSAPLLVHGLRTAISDIDVVARGQAWRLASSQGVPESGKITGEQMATFWGGLIEVSQQWITENLKVDDLIARADVIEGLRFAALEDVLSYKLAHSHSRTKDLKDAAILRRHLYGDDLAEAFVRGGPATGC